MGIFDDLKSVAKEYNAIKQDMTSAVGGFVAEVTSLKDETTASVAKVKQDVISVKTDVTNNISKSLSGSDEQK